MYWNYIMFYMMGYPWGNGGRERNNFIYCIPASKEKADSPSLIIGYQNKPRDVIEK